MITTQRIYSIAFVGTYPLHVDDEDSSQTPSSGSPSCSSHSYFLNGKEVIRFRYRKNDKLADGCSNFRNVKRFILTHSSQIDYKFFIFKHNNQMNENTDELFESHIVDRDLNLGLPEGMNSSFDIVYIDTNTLELIDEKKTSYEWIDFFKPLMKPNGCLIIDDNDRFKRGLGINTFLGKIVYNGLTSRVYCPNVSHLQFHDQLLQDFVDNVVRHPNENIILYNTTFSENTFNSSNKHAFLTEKKNWSL